MEELLSLKWNNHRTTFLHILTVLRDKQLYTDATLACDGKLYSVHKLVLSTCSDYFSSMLDRTSCKNPVIVLKDIKCEDLEALLDYMYLGEVNVRQSDLATLIKAAECLRVKGLAVPDDDPRPTPRKTRVNETQSRRRDTSISPPAKRKRRSDVDDGRDDVRPVRQEPRQSSPVHSSSHVRPKSPLNNSNTSSSISNKIVPTVNSSSVNSNLDTKIDNSVDNENIVPSVKVEVVEDDLDGIDDRPDGVVDTGGGDSSVGVDLTDNYNLNNEDFKEEDDDTDGADLGTDLPEFLQQATANYPHSSFPGTSFQPDLSWQGGDGGSGNSGGMAGSFAAAAAAGLSFGSSVQDGQNTSSGELQRGRGEGSGRGGHPIPGFAAISGPTDALVCKYCGKLFTGRNRHQRIQFHALTHTGEKPHPCPYCPYRARLKYNLKKHVRTMHRDFLETYETIENTTKEVLIGEAGSIASYQDDGEPGQGQEILNVGIASNSLVLDADGMARSNSAPSNMIPAIPERLAYGNMVTNNPESGIQIQWNDETTTQAVNLQLNKISSQHFDDNRVQTIPNNLRLEHS